jgi:hypothetical protein
MRNKQKKGEDKKTYPSVLSSYGPFSLAEEALRLAFVFFSYIGRYQTRVLSLIYVYIVLQVVGLVWAIVANATVSLGLIVAKEFGPNAGVSNFFSDIGRAEILATFYVVYSTFRVVLRFLNACIETVWDSVNDFPNCRTAIQLFSADRSFLILFATFFPVALLAVSIIVTGWVCHTSGVYVHVQDVVNTMTSWLPEQNQRVINSQLQYFCVDSPFAFIAEGSFLPRRILSLSIMLYIYQFCAVILSQFPDWREIIRRKKRWAFIFDCLTGVFGLLTLLYLLNTAVTLYYNIPILEQVRTGMLFKQVNTSSIEL